MIRSIHSLSRLFMSMLFAGVTFTFAQNVTGVTTLGDTVRLDLGADAVDIIPTSESIVEIDYNVAKAKSPATLIVNPALKSTTAFTSKDVAGDPLVFKTAQYTLKVTKTPFTIEFINAANVTLFKTASGSFTKNSCDATVINGNYYGCYSDPKNASSLTFNGKYDIKSGTQGYAGAPYLFTTKGFGILFDTDYGSLELTGSTLKQLRTNSYGVASRQSNAVFLMVGANPPEMMKNFYTISGFMQMPPLWSMGFMNSQWGMDEKEMRDIVAKYREKKIPIDAIVFDFDWMDWGKDNYGENRWNATKFPSAPTGVLKTDMDKLGIHIMGIRKPRLAADMTQGVEAKAKGYALTGTEAVDYTGVNCVNLDFYKQEVRDWYWQIFSDPSRNPFKTGMIAFWNDEADEDKTGNSKVFNFMGMQRSQYEGQRVMNNTRVFSLNRNFFCGSQRYGYGQWTGDIGTGFAAMGQQPMNILKSGLVGSGWTSMDIGGFFDQPTDENYYRWMQIGAFSPNYRVHASLGLKRQPWVFNADAERISKKAIELRYRLLPYIYSMYWKLSSKGMPIMHPLMMDFPNDAKASNDVRSYMFGDYIMPAPIYAMSSKSATFYLPTCGWYNYYTGAYSAGGSDITVTTDGDVIPVMIRKGAVIPTRPQSQYSGDSIGMSEITFNVYAGDSATFNYYEDDFNSYDYEKGIYAEIPYVHTVDGAVERLNVLPQKGTYTPPARKGYFVFYGLAKMPKFVVRKGVQLANVEPGKLAVNTWTNDSGRVKVMVDDPFAASDIVLTDDAAVRFPVASRFSDGINLIQLPQGKMRVSLASKVQDKVSVDIVNLNGKRLGRIYTGDVNPGMQSFDITLGQYAAQACYCVITISNKQIVRKLLLTK